MDTLVKANDNRRKKRKQPNRAREGVALFRSASPLPSVEFRPPPQRLGACPLLLHRGRKILD